MLRSSSLFRYTARLAILLPFAVLGAACGDDASSDPGSSSGTVGEGGTGTETGSGNEGGSEGPDLTAPTVLTTSPAPAAIGVSTSSEITATFSEAMAHLTLTGGTTFTLTRGGVDVAGTPSYFDNTASFLPTADLALDTSYVATISTAATDVAGNALAAAYIWSFKTDATARVGPAPVVLGAAGKYVVLAKAEITNVPTSKVTGNMGISPAAASYITGFGMTKAGTRWTTPQVVGSVFAADNDAPTPSNLTTAINNMLTAYTDAAGRPNPILDFDAGVLGADPLPPGLYKWTTSVTIPANITIAGAANDTWIFQISGDLMMSANKLMTMSGGARAKNVVWQVAGFVDLGTGAHAEGIILSKTLIKLGTGATINGRLMAQTAVNIASSTITAPAQ